jgi:hypothetical protein
MQAASCLNPTMGGGRRPRHVLWLAGLALLGIAGTCDHTRLRGTIVVDRHRPVVGDSIGLRLEVPAELDGIHWVSWNATPSSACSVSYVRVERDERSRSKADRAATLVAEAAGACHIEVSGFYKQTNPQPITELDLEIQPRHPE